jgi:hypothetical protein
VKDAETELLKLAALDADDLAVISAHRLPAGAQTAPAVENPCAIRRLRAGPAGRARG